MALALAVTEGDNIELSLDRWEERQRPITEHVQNWSYFYGYVLGKWPSALAGLRSDLLRAIAKTEWFEEGLNRGARTVPAGYRATLSSHPGSAHSEADSAARAAAE
jgi:hypothetical protein